MMDIRILATGLTAAVALFCSVPTEAAVILGSDFTNGLTSQPFQGITFTSTGGAFEKKTVGGVTGVGVSGGGTAGEIDINQSITGTAPSFNIGSITLGFLFDGPEFLDVNEVAQITINNNPLTTFTLTVTGATTANLSANAPAGAGVKNLSPATDTGAAVWLLSNLNFINVQTVSFTALTGNPGPGCGNPPSPSNCTNQSDFALVALDTNVPEPTTLGLIGVGLLGLGAMARRRRKAA